MTRTQMASAGSGVTARRDVLIALAIKLILLTILYRCFFAESHRLNVDPQTMATTLLDHAPKKVSP